MSATKVKICGLSRPQDIVYVNEAFPDYIGFVFAPSRRQVSPETAYKLKTALDDRIQSVGVFVNEAINTISRLCKEGIIDLIQLHGDESHDYIEELRQYTDKSIIKVFQIKTDESVEYINRYSCDYLLLDTYSPRNYGGTGEAFDWSLINNIRKSFFLAGGIGPKNARIAIETVHPFCLDASSSLEISGVKDREKIIQFVKTVRSVE
jgi:phosphoribosylanthranilate isomerase